LFFRKNHKLFQVDFKMPPYTPLKKTEENIMDYDITLNADDIEKEFIDELRCRNGNLEICISTLMPREAAEL